jgi:hypothetical protein
LTACSKCGRELPEGALFCPDCGASAVDYSVAQPGVSPSHFNSVMTTTSSPQLTTEPPAPADDPGFPQSAPSFPEEKKRSGRRGLMLAIIAILAILLVATTFETGMFGSTAAPVVNSASTPLTGEQLYTAYQSNQSQADASYTNKTVYIQDSLDFGVGRDYSTGQYYSSVDSGNVILFWNGQSQLSQLFAGTTVLAKCSVDGVQFSPGSGYLLILEDCALVSVQSQTSSSANVSAANL